MVSIYKWRDKKTWRDERNWFGSREVLGILNIQVNDLQRPLATPVTVPHFTLNHILNLKQRLRKKKGILLEKKQSRKRISSQLPVSLSSKTMLS